MDCSTTVAACGYTSHFGCRDAVSLNVGGLQSGRSSMQLGQHNMDRSTTAEFIKAGEKYKQRNICTHTLQPDQSGICPMEQHVRMSWTRIIRFFKKAQTQRQTI